MSNHAFRDLLFYGSIAAIYIISCSRELNPRVNAEFLKRGIYINSNFGGKFKFLTILNLYAQVIYFIIRTLNAFYELFAGKNDHHQTMMKKLANFLYTTLIFPVGACVTIQFWGIYLVNRDLIFPKILDEVIPPWHNHILHTLPLVAAIGDNLMTRHVYKKSFFWGVLPTVIYAVAYLTWVHIIYYYGNFWVYPVLEFLGPFYRTVFFLVSILILVGFYKLGLAVNTTIWSNTKQQQPVTKTKTTKRN